MRDAKYNSIRRAFDIFHELLAERDRRRRRRRHNGVRGADGSQPGHSRRVRARAIAELDSNVPVFDLSTEGDKIDGLIRQDRLLAGLSATFGALALLLAAIGLYGIRAYSVARRTSEIGIRMALGAGRVTLIQMILRETAGLALLGVVIGLATAYAVTRYVQSMLYGVAPRDFMTFAGATAVLILVTVLAGYFPARLAARIDPMIALRHD